MRINRNSNSGFVLLLFAAGYLFIVTVNNGCAKKVTNKTSQSDSNEGQPLIDSGQDPSHNDQLLKIARDYLSYAIVNKQPKMAPELCMAPPAVPGMSESEDVISHGSKLYFLFASHPLEYRDAATQKSPIGQTLVKEAWSADDANGADSGKAAPINFVRHQCGRTVSSKLSKDGNEYVLGNQKDLFIMYKTKDTAATDQGWVYGVVSPGGKQVIAGGKLDNCMSCHSEAGVDRLFGQN